MQVRGIHKIKIWGGAALAACLVGLLCAGSVFAAETWIDEIWNMVVFEKGSYPQSDFNPYFEKLTAMRNAQSKEDHLLVRQETARFLGMLASRAHGIHDVAADEIYNFALLVKPTDEAVSGTVNELGISNQRPMSVPEHMINTPYEGGPPCKLDGCDYWRDDVFDPGAS